MPGSLAYQSGSVSSPEPASRRTSLSPSQGRSLSVLLLSLLVLAAVLPWWNRFIGVTNDAWHYFYGQQILAGKVPYRDFYLFVPPLSPLKNALLITVFGDRIVVPHLIAIAELMILAGVLIFWISRFLPVFETAVGVTTAMALYIFCMNSETLSGLHQEAVFFPVLAGWAASVSLRRRRAMFFVLTGLLAGLALLAKQTSGVATLVFIGVLLALLLWRMDGTRPAVKAAFWYATGAAVPVTIVCIWLGRNGALGAFLSEAFLRGSSSKGSLSSTLLRPVIMVSRQIGYQLEVVLAVFCLGVFFWFARGPQETREPRLSPRSRLLLFYAAAGLAILLGVVASRHFSLQRPHVFIKAFPRDFLLFFGELGCFALFVQSVWLFLKGRITEQQAQLLLLTGFGSGLAYLLGCSWVDYVPIVLPSLAVVLAHVLSRRSTKPGWKYFRAASIAICLMAIVQFCAWRMGTPFGFGGWQEPNVRFSSQSFAEAELTGLHASPESARFVDQVTRDIVANSTPTDTVLAYPDIPLFYILSHRTPATFGYVHYMDVAPDFLDEADAARILRNPPAVIVYWDQSEEELRAAELEFRNGRRSGLRAFQSALAALKPHYRMLDTFESSTGDRFVVMAREARLDPIYPDTQRVAERNAPRHAE